jgi:hypothetical protein
MDCNAAKSAAQKMFPNAKCEASYLHAESTNGFSTSNYTTYEIAVVFEENRTSQYHNEPLSITNKSEDSFELCLLSLKVAVFELGRSKYARRRRSSSCGSSRTGDK